jgi:hypothetical protein
VARLMKPRDVETLLASSWQSHLRQREEMVELDQWYRGKQQEIQDPDDSGMPFMPDGSATTKEYMDIAGRAPTPWANLLVKSMAQTCSLEGVYLPGSSTTLESWKLWQENRWDARQGAVYRGALAHGMSFATALPAKSMWTGDRTARFEAHSAIKMSAYYAEVEDEFPMYVIEAEKRVDHEGRRYWEVSLIDEQAVHLLEVEGDGVDRKDFKYIAPEEHGLGFCPAILYPCERDLDGKVTGEIEPFIPLLRRIDQDIFDRLIVQRFGAWVVRYGTGLVKPETDEDARAQAILLRVGEMLVSENAQSKFGTLQPTDLKGFIEAHDADLRILSAVSQRPPHHLLGAAANLQAESLAAVEQGMNRRGHEFRTGVGESHELLMRTGALIIGKTDEARAFDMQVRWRDMESRSFAQTAQALGMVATQLQVPVEILWERIPGWTDSDTARAKSAQSLGGISQLLTEIAKQTTPPNQPPAPAPAA